MKDCSPYIRTAFLRRDNFTAKHTTLKIPKQLAGAVKKRQLDFLCGRQCAQLAMAQLTGHVFPALLSDADGVPVFPDTLVGSISHCATFAFAAVAPKNHVASVGCDVEDLIPKERLARIECEFLSPREIDVIQSCADEQEQPRLKTLVFSAKESIYKCFYPMVRQPFGLLDLAVASIHQPRQVIHFDLSTLDEKSLLQQTACTVHYDFLGCARETCLTVCSTP